MNNWDRLEGFSAEVSYTIDSISGWVNWYHNGDVDVHPVYIELKTLDLNIYEKRPLEKN